MVANAAGRFAATSLASSYGSSSATQAKSPPAPPRRTIGSHDESPGSDRPSPSGGSGGGLSSFMSGKVSLSKSVPAVISSNEFFRQRLGDIDTSSMKSVLTSSFRGGKPAPAPASTTLPPAFGAPKRNFAPPPMRRAPPSSEDNAADSAESRLPRQPNEDLAPLRRMPSDRALRNTATPDLQPAHGERAEAMYDYTSEVSGFDDKLCFR